MDRFHSTLRDLHSDFSDATLESRITDDQFLQGPLSDAMTHAGQLAMLRRLEGTPVAPENFIFAKIATDNVEREQPEPAAPDSDWTPDAGHRSPGWRRR